MDKIYLTQDVLKSLNKVSRYLTRNHGIVTKMTDEKLLIKVFHSCRYIKDDKLSIMFQEIKHQMSQPIDGDLTLFAFDIDDYVIRCVGMEENGHFEESLSKLTQKKSWFSNNKQRLSVK